MIFRLIDAPPQRNSIRLPFSFIATTSTDSGRMGCRRRREGSTATFAAIDRNGKAETDSKFALMGASTESISFQTWLPIAAGAPSPSGLGGISRQRCYGQTRKPRTIAPLTGEDHDTLCSAQQKRCAMDHGGAPDDKSFRCNHRKSAMIRRSPT